MQDLAKYAEVHAKAKNVAAVQEKDEPFGRGVWVGFTYKPRGKAIDEEVSDTSLGILSVCDGRADDVDVTALADSGTAGSRCRG